MPLNREHNTVDTPMIAVTQQVHDLISAKREALELDGYCKYGRVTFDDVLRYELRLPKNRWYSKRSK